MPVVRGGAPAFTQVRRGADPIIQIRRGHALKWSRASIFDPFDIDGFLTDWINELLSTDPGALCTDGLGVLTDQLENQFGRLVLYVDGGVNRIGTMVNMAGTDLVDAYCGVWGGESPPDGLVGLVNDIPIIGGVLGDWLSADLDIQKIVGQIPVVGQLAEMIGLVPDQLGNLLDPINYVVDEAGNVVGKLTCGRLDVDGVLEDICYQIGVVGQSARMLIPDGLVALDPQTSLYRHPTILTADDGWIETQVTEVGFPGLVTQLYRRYSDDGSGAAGVGMDLRDSAVSIVRRVGGEETLVAPNLARFGSGDRLRLEQDGDLHTLIVNGSEAGSWLDDTGSAASGVGTQSVSMLMQGGKGLQSTRRFSPSLNYVEAG